MTPNLYTTSLPVSQKIKELHLNGRCVKYTEGSIPNEHNYHWFIGHAKKGAEPYCYGYKKDNTTGGLYAMHRLIMGLEKGDKRVVDHINHNTLDNTVENLRVCTTSQNQMNSKISPKNSSGYKGVSFYRALNKWQAKIKMDGKSRHIGYYCTASEASDAYQQYADKIFGKFKSKIEK